MLFLRLIPLLSCVLLLSGCAGYRMGPTAGFPAGSRSIQVNPFQNNTLEPRLVDAVTFALRKSLQQDGTYRLATQNDGDVIVSGAIVRFVRTGLSYKESDTLTMRDYELTLVTKVTAKERSSGKVLFSRDVKGRTTVRTSADQTSTERQAVPQAAEDLARNITSLLVDGTW